MRRVVSLFLPDWSTDRLRRKTGKPPPEAPFVTATPDHARRIVASADRAALALGIRPGMTIARARALAPELVVADAEPEEDLAGLERLALWAGRRYSPVVAIDPPAGIWIDITGCCGRFEGELPLLKDLHRRVVASGFAVQVAVADTAGCAHAVARHVPAGQPIVIDPGKTRAALSLLPVAALRIEPGIAAELTRMGFARVEQLIATSRAPLVKRFGAGLMTRLDQALGQRPEPIEPIFPPEIPRCRRRLLEPIGTAEAFTQVIGDLAASLVRKLTRASTGVRRLDLIFHRVDGQAQAIRVGTAKPTRDARHIAKLLAQKLETVDPGMGVEAMTLVASLTEPLGSAQGEGLLSAQRKGPDLAALANRFGQRALCRTIPQPGTMPERQVAIVAPLAKACGAGWADDLPRPARMLSPPEPIEVTAMLPDHPPAMFRWRGRRYRIAQADGPERLHGEWWRAAGHEADTPYIVRDYYQVETQSGERYWVFRLGDGERPATGPMRWFIHGAFA